MVKEELDKLLEVRFIKPVEIIEWVSPMVLVLKNGKLRVCVNNKALNKVTKKIDTLCHFVKKFWR
jgi:hypothetical protein